MMDIQFYGANAIKLTSKKATVVIDDNLADLGLKSVAKSGDIMLFTSAHAGHPEAKIVIDQPGEYEVSEITINGIATQAHIDEPGQHNATIYKLVMDDIRIAVLGHIYPNLDEDQLEALGIVDVLLVPVGGMGFTLDGVGALTLIKEIEPKIIIPTHYADAAINYPVPQQSLEESLKSLAMEPKETIAKLKIKAGEIAEISSLIVLERQ
ncbi:MAG: MBL fold metallo-hydrolase [Candidatus Saccharimonadales bacterium]